MGFLSKLFGGEKKQSESPTKFAKYVLEGLFERAEFDLDFDINETSIEEGFQLDIKLSGPDSAMVVKKMRSDVLLDSLQVFVKKALQHNFSGQKVNINLDCEGYREKAKQALIELAEKLMNSAIDQGKTVYVRSLPPKDRKVIHQFLAEDGRVKSRSIGDGLYKKIKIYPVSPDEQNSNDQVY